MQIADHGLRPKAVEAAEIFDGSLKGLAGFDGFEISDVLAEKDVVADGDGDRILQVSADGEQGRKFLGNANAQRCVAASTAQNSGASAREAHDRIITGANDRPVMHQEMIGNVFQASGGFVVGNRNWFVTAVAAGGD